MLISAAVAVSQRFPPALLPLCAQLAQLLLVAPLFPQRNNQQQQQDNPPCCCYRLYLRHRNNGALPFFRNLLFFLLHLLASNDTQLLHKRQLINPEEWHRLRTAATTIPLPPLL